MKEANPFLFYRLSHKEFAKACMCFVSSQGFLLHPHRADLGKEQYYRLNGFNIMTKPPKKQT